MPQAPPSCSQKAGDFPEDNPLTSAFQFFKDDPKVKGYADELYERICEGTTEIFVDQIEQAIITAAVQVGNEASDEEKRRAYIREIREHAGRYLAHIGRFALNSNLVKIQRSN